MLLGAVAKVLGDEGIRPDLRLPLERALDELRDALARWQATRRYAPLSRNPLFMLTGLLFEGFIDIAEYQHISHAPEFVSQVKAAHVGPFFDAITTLFQRIADTKPDVRTARLQQHHDLLERGVAGALADAVDRAFDLARAGLDACEGVGHREAQVVVAVGGQHNA